MITAAYVPLPNYHQLFAESQNARQLVLSSAQQLSLQQMGGVPGFNMTMQMAQ